MELPLGAELSTGGRGFEGPLEVVFGFVGCGGILETTVGGSFGVLIPIFRRPVSLPLYIV